MTDLHNTFAQTGAITLKDSQIIELFFKRSTDAITYLDKEYGKLCHRIAYNITKNPEDAQECTNDAYFHIWNSIPPLIPRSLSAYVSKTTRNIAINRIKHCNCQKRYQKLEILYSELLASFPSDENIESSCDTTITDEINHFLKTLDTENRILFIRRYYDMESIESLSKHYNVNKGTVYTRLYRIRKKLKKHLTQKGIYL